MTRRYFAALALILLLPASSAATIRLVKADGTGDYPTIQAAVDAAVDGDEVHMVAGTYEGDGNRNVDFEGKAITVRSQDLDPASVVIAPWIDPLTDVHAFVLDSGEGAATIIESLTIRGGRFDSYQLDGGIVHCVNASPTIRDCVFQQNQGCSIMSVGGQLLIEGCRFYNNASYYGSPILSAAVATVTTCEFIENSMGDDGGGSCCVSVGAGLVSHCLFMGNVGYLSGGALCSGGVVEDCNFLGNGYTLSAGAFSGSGTIRRCLFSGNIAFQRASAVYVSGPTVIESCTFTGNDCRLYGDVIRVGAGTLILSNSIIAFNYQSKFDKPCTAIAVDAGSATITCTDIFGNDCEDWGGAIADQLGLDRNISADPLFCESVQGIYSTSPCAPANSAGCGLIGVYGVACDPSSVEAKSWGEIKGLYR